MSALTACWLIAIVLFLGGSFLALALCRAAGRVSRAEEARGLAVWDVAAERWVRLPRGAEKGPGRLTAREVEEADALALDAGCDRLWAAIEDQQKGDQA